MIKSRRKDTKKTPKAGNAKGATAKDKKTAAAAKKRGAVKKSPGGASNRGGGTAKSVGKAKASRAKVAANRRGLAASKKVSKKEVKKQVQRQQTKNKTAAKRATKATTGRVRVNAAGIRVQDRRPRAGSSVVSRLQKNQRTAKAAPKAFATRNAPKTMQNAAISSLKKQGFAVPKGAKLVYPSKPGPPPTKKSNNVRNSARNNNGGGRNNSSSSNNNKSKVRMDEERSDSKSKSIISFQHK